MIDQEELDDLLDKWEEAREQGQDLSAGELCQDCPELEAELLARIRALKATEWMLEDEEPDVDYLPLPPAEELSARTLVPASLSLAQFTTNITTSGVLTGDELSRFDASDAQDLAGWRAHRLDRDRQQSDLAKAPTSLRQWVEKEERLPTGQGIDDASGMDGN